MSHEESDLADREELQPVSVGPSAVELMEFVRRSHLVNLDVQLSVVAEQASLFARHRGVNILMITSYFLVTHSR